MMAPVDVPPTSEVPDTATLLSASPSEIAAVPAAVTVPLRFTTLGAAAVTPPVKFSASPPSPSVTAP
ncbi:MAG: hypothetical protein VX813_01595, partial [Actinomycetota bacterium]|nr:hypothetical protein [Actinomycetota bacterium]